MVKFKATKRERELIDIVTERAIRELEIKDRVSLTMDLDAVHSNGTRLDFAKLLGFNTFNFVHDIYGIRKNLNRKTGKLENCFLPRCSAAAKKKRTREDDGDA